MKRRISTSEEVFAEIMARETLRPQLKESMARIRAACDALEKVKAPIEVRSVAEMIFQTAGASGPTAGSIRNQKETLLSYVYLRRSEQELPGTLEERAEAGPPIHDKKIADFVRLLQQQLRRVTADRDRLSSAFKNLDPVAFDRLTGATPANQVSAGPAMGTGAHAPGALAAAATSLFDRKNLERLGLEIGLSEGQVVLRHRFQRWILFWEAELAALAMQANISFDDLRETTLATKS